MSFMRAFAIAFLLSSTPVFAWKDNIALKSAEAALQSLISNDKRQFINELTTTQNNFKADPSLEHAQKLLEVYQTYYTSIPDLEDADMRVAIASCYFLIYEMDQENDLPLFEAARMWLTLHDEGEDFVSQETILTAVGSIIRSASQYTGLEAEQRINCFVKAVEIFELYQAKYPNEMQSVAISNAALCYTELSQHNFPVFHTQEEKIAYLKEALRLYEILDDQNYDFVMGMVIAAVSAHGNAVTRDWVEEKHLKLYAKFFYKLIQYIKEFDLDPEIATGTAEILIVALGLDKCNAEKGRNAVKLFSYMCKACGEDTPKVIVEAIASHMDFFVLPDDVLQQAYFYDYQARYHQAAHKIESLITAGRLYYHAYLQNPAQLSHLAKAAKRYEAAVKTEPQYMKSGHVFMAGTSYLELAKAAIGGPRAIMKAVKYFDRYIALGYKAFDSDQLRETIDELDKLYQYSGKTCDLVKFLEYALHLRNHHKPIWDKQLIKPILKALIAFYQTAPGREYILKELVAMGESAVRMGECVSFLKDDPEFIVLSKTFQETVLKKYPITTGDILMYNSISLMPLTRK